MTDEQFELLKVVNKKLDKLIELSEQQMKEWENNKSFAHFMKNWAGFYIAGLLAD